VWRDPDCTRRERHACSHASLGSMLAGIMAGPGPADSSSIELFWYFTMIIDIQHLGWVLCGMTALGKLVDRVLFLD